MINLLQQVRTLAWKCHVNINFGGVNNKRFPEAKYNNAEEFTKQSQTALYMYHLAMPLNTTAMKEEVK